MSEEGFLQKEISLLQKTARELTLLQGLCQEWQASENGFWSFEQVIKSFNEPGVKAFYSTADQKMTGFLLFQIAPGFSELLYLFVTHTWRRKKLGQELMNTYEAYLKSIPDCGTIFLEVRSTNDGAQKLYHSLGFRQFGRRKGYYSNGDDALNFRKEIHT